MVLLQPKLHLKVSQRQILTPGLVQMVSVLALNKLELKDMINAEMVENPVLEELEDSVPLLDDVNRREEERTTASEENPITAVEKKDPFEEIDFGSFFQDYLDPGYRSPGEMEEVERPSFENFLSRPSNLTDHLIWQLGSLPIRAAVREAAELIIGNLSEDGYLIASDEELLGTVPPAAPDADANVVESVVREAAALGLSSAGNGDSPTLSNLDEPPSAASDWQEIESSVSQEIAADAPIAEARNGDPVRPAAEAVHASAAAVNFSAEDLREAIELVRHFDPPGVACRDPRECLLCQLRFHQQQLAGAKNDNGEDFAQVLSDAAAIVDQHPGRGPNKQFKE